MPKPIQLDLVKNIPDLVNLGQINDRENEGRCTFFDFGFSCFGLFVMNLHELNI